jgi:hypothetical protein
LKYGKKGKPLSTSMDLTSASLQLSGDNRSKFKILTPRGPTLSLKADSPQDRDAWIQGITQMIQRAKNGDMFLEIVDNTSIE